MMMMMMMICRFRHSHQLDTLHLHILPQLFKRNPKFLKLTYVQLINRSLPPELRLSGLLDALELFSTLILLFQLIQHINQHQVVDTNTVFSAVSLKHLQRHGGLVVLTVVEFKEAFDDRVDIWVSKGEDLVGRGEDKKGYLCTAERGELTCFLEQTSSSLREGHVKAVLVGDLGYGDLLTAQTGFLCHGRYSHLHPTVRNDEDQEQKM